MRQLPGVWRLRGQLQLAELLKGPKQAPAMAHLSTPATSGQPQSFTPPPKHTAVPLDRSYMPSTGEAPNTPGVFPCTLHFLGTCKSLLQER